LLFFPPPPFLPYGVSLLLRVFVKRFPYHTHSWYHLKFSLSQRYLCPWTWKFSPLPWELKRCFFEGFSTFRPFLPPLRGLLRHTPPSHPPPLQVTRRSWCNVARLTQSASHPAVSNRNPSTHKSAERKNLSTTVVSVISAPFPSHFSATLRSGPPGYFSLQQVWSSAWAFPLLPFFLTPPPADVSIFFF